MSRIVSTLTPLTFKLPEAASSSQLRIAPNTGFAYGYRTRLALVNFVDMWCGIDVYGWICVHASPYSIWSCGLDPVCSATVGLVDRTDWKPFGNKIEYRLSEQISQQCTVELSPELASIVIIFNIEYIPSQHPFPSLCAKG